MAVDLSRRGRDAMAQAALVFFLLAVLKTPGIFLHPRFWAEEGSVFFRDLQGASLIDAAGYVYRGSILLPTSLGVWLATLAPLSLAPAITTYLAFAVQTGVAALIGLWGSERGLSKCVVFLLIGAWVLLPATYEVWATATNMQWTFSIAMLLVMLLPEEVLKRFAWAWRILALSSGLSGVPPCMLTPGFLVTGLRSRTHLRLGLLLGMCAVLQLAVLIANPSSGRHLHFDGGLTALLIAKSTITILTGMHFWISTLGIGPSSSIHVIMALAAVGLLAFAVAAVSAATVAPQSAMLLAGSSLLVATLNVLGALGDPWGVIWYISGRYMLFTSLAFCFLIALTSKHPRWGSIATAVLATIVIVGVFDRLSPAYWPFVEGPNWNNELSSCRPESKCRLIIWPSGFRGSTWSVDVNTE